MVKNNILSPTKVERVDICLTLLINGMKTCMLTFNSLKTLLMYKQVQNINLKKDTAILMRFYSGFLQSLFFLFCFFLQKEPFVLKPRLFFYIKILIGSRKCQSSIPTARSPASSKQLALSNGSGPRFSVSPLRMQ